MARRSPQRACLFLLGVLLSPPPPAAAGLAKDLVEKLEKAPYVYISSTRKDGALSTPAEIWFFYDQGAVYVGTRPDSWRVRRIKAGRPQAKIWIGEPNGPRRMTVTEREIQILPSFKARGEIVNDPKMHARLHEVFAQKYAAEWPDYKNLFRFEGGNRVMVKYTPID